jgi:uncharacterized membrane protein
MTGLTLIVIARALHILASVAWAGFVIVIAAAVVAMPRGEDAPDARRIRQSVVSRGARIVGPAAAISLISGLYLFSALHAGAHTITETVLAVGAFTAVLSFLIGAIGSGPAERRLARLDQAKAAGAFTEGDAQTIAKLDRRVVITARLTAALLLVSTLAMAIARFV